MAQAYSQLPLFATELQTKRTWARWSDREIAGLEAIYTDYSHDRLRAFAEEHGRSVETCWSKAQQLGVTLSRQERIVARYPATVLVCPGCGETVRRRWHTQKYCTPGCAHRNKKGRPRQGKTVPCALCGKAIYITPHRLGLPAYFCCHAHANEWQGRNKVLATCRTCGAQKRVSPSRLKVGQPYYCGIVCRDADPAKHEQLIAMNVAQQRGKQTTIERAGYAMLDEIGVEYLPQHLIGGKFCVDAFVPSAALVIQFDGDYWHGHPERFPAPDARQRRRMKLDLSQDAYMRACGYAVLRLWEAQIRRAPEEIRLLLRRALCRILPMAGQPADDQR